MDSNRTRHHKPFSIFMLYICFGIDLGDKLKIQIGIIDFFL